jgi:hypothetical protein
MPTAHPRPWHSASTFGPGPRRPLDREQRARFRFLLNQHRRVRRLTATHEMIGNALLKRLGIDGQLDPAHQTIAADVGCSERTVRRGLEALKALGLVMWARRIVRAGWRVAQTSNAYLLAPIAMTNGPEIPASRCGGHSGRQTLKVSFASAPDASAAAAKEARAALARRRGVIEQRMLDRGIS